MLELPEECPGYDYGLKVACKEAEMDTIETSLPPGRLNVGTTNQKLHLY